MSFVPTTHNNPSFNDALANIGSQLSDISRLCENSLKIACQVLDIGDAKLAKSISDQDGKINNLEEQITLAVATTLARHNPVAHDLHALMGSVKMAQEFERLADHAKNICRRVVWLQKFELEVAFKADMLKLGKQSLAMLTKFLDAMDEDNIEKARDAWQLDENTNRVYENIMDRALAGEEAGNARQIINSVFIAKNFERIGDKVKNLAEIAYYQKTGEITDFDHIDDADLV